MAENYINHWNANGQMYDIQDAGRGLPNGVATLDLTGRVPYSQLPESAVEFKGYWNATTNTPTLADGTGTKGDMYYVDVPGTQDLGSGTQRFYVGDRVLYDGSVWKNMNPDLIDLFLPVGHLIWTGNANFNPNTQYPGTTWTQVKDKFVLAAGDTYTNGATGGSATVTLTVDQIPSHTHTFTGSAVTTNANNRGHTHSVTASGTVGGNTAGGSISGGAYKFTGTAVTSGPMSGNDKGSVTIKAPFTAANQNGNLKLTSVQENWASGQTWQDRSDKISIDVSHTHSVTASGTISVTTNPTFTGTSHAHTFTGSAVTSGAESQNHTHSVTASGSNSSTGGGQAHNNMPPYIVKYCWERTA